MPETLTVVAHDQKADEAIPHPYSKYIRIVRKATESLRSEAKNVFVLSSSTTLPEVSDLVTQLNRRHHLRALFVREDADPELLPQLLDRADIRALRNMLVHQGPEVPSRVLRAWMLDAEGDLIANAAIVDGRLLVVSCDLRRYEVDVEEVSGLAAIPKEEREEFEIADDGAYLHWPGHDLHVTLDTIRYVTDPQWRKEADVRRLREDERFGEAVRSLRVRMSLTQKDIEGLSDRQVRRIEKGKSVSPSAVEALARAHDMSVNGYLSAVADLMEEKEKEEAS